jgi:hypothetical protein
LWKKSNKIILVIILETYLWFSRFTGFIYKIMQIKKETENSVS